MKSVRDSYFDRVSKKTHLEEKLAVVVLTAALITELGLVVHLGVFTVAIFFFLAYSSFFR